MMMQVNLTYDDSARTLALGAGEYVGTTLDKTSVRITVSGIPEGYFSRLDFNVSVQIPGRKKKTQPYLELDATGSCIVTNSILDACKQDLRLPMQLVLQSGEVRYASRNWIIMEVSPSINALDTITESYQPNVIRAFVDVAEEGGRITFTRMDGSSVSIRVDDDFVAWSDVVTDIPETATDHQVMTAKLIKDRYVPKSSVVDTWSQFIQPGYVPTERLVKTHLDLKADDVDVVHIDEGCPKWSSEVTYHAGSTVIHELTFYISQNEPNVNHSPDEEGSVWWSKVTGSGGGGGEQQPGAYKVFTIGDGVHGAFAIAHNFNSYIVDHVLFSSTGRYDHIVDFMRMDKDRVRVMFNTAPAVGEYTLIVYRPGLGPESVVTTINGQQGDITIVPEMFSAVAYSVQSLTSAQQAQARDNIGLGDVATRNVGTNAGNVPVLDANGKLAGSTIPSLAITEYLGTVVSKSALVNFAGAQRGDWATVTAGTATERGAWMLNGSPATLNDWVQISGPGNVLEVNGETGAVTVTPAKIGALAPSDVVDNLTYPGAANRPISAKQAVSLNIVKVEQVSSLPAVTTNGRVYLLTQASGSYKSGHMYSASISAGVITWVDLTPYGTAANLDAGVAGGNAAVIPAGGVAAQSLRMNAGGTALEWFTPSSSTLAKYNGSITGNGTLKTFSVNHGLSGIPMVQVVSAGTVVYPDTDVTATTITITFNTAPASGAVYGIRAIA